MRIADFLRTPEPTMMVAAAAGEMLLAKFRIGVLVLIVLVPTYKLITGSDLTWAVSTAYVAMVFAIGLYLFLRRYEYRPSIGFLSVSADVGLISIGLLLDVIARQTPLAAVNNKGTFDLYFLTLVASCLRYDRRICLYAGALTLLVYCGFLTAAVNTPTLDATQWIDRYGRFYAPDQVSRVLFLAMATGLSFVLVARSSMLLDLAVRDPLTSLYNRGFLQEHMALSTDRAKRDGRPFAVAMIDVDYFKRINDTYGHTAGDAALRGFALFLRQRLRDVDLVARYGGEEFCVVFANADIGTARAVLDKLREQVHQQTFRVPGGKEALQINFSAGIAEWRRDAEDGAGLIRVADQRLLEAKAAGRDRIVGP